MVGIICFWDRTATPYLAKYEACLEALGMEYEVIFWNRTGSDKKPTEKEQYINYYCHVSQARKYVDFFGWRSRILSILKKKKYDKLIILSTMPGVLLYPYLQRHYKRKYIFDIRDYTMEKNPVFGGVVNRLVKNSGLSPISSPGFFSWLKPSDRLVVNHNFTFTSCEDVQREYFTRDVLNFSMVGNIRLPLQARLMITCLGNSKRYRSCFIGRMLPGCDLAEYCEKEQVHNVSIRGEFDNTEKPAIYRDTDLINSVYADGPIDQITSAGKTLLPNRLYDCLVFKVPIVCSKDVFMEELVKKYNIGFSVDVYNDDVEACFDRYVESFDKDAFLKGTEELLELCLQEEEIYKNRVKEFLQGV